MTKLAVSLILGFAIGIFCRAAGLPSPGPPFFQGAFLVCMMTVGFIVTDLGLKRASSAKKEQISS